MEDKRSREILEFKKFLRESREKPDLDRYAQKLFGERMEALGFTTFKNHRWDGGAGVHDVQKSPVVQTRAR